MVNSKYTSWRRLELSPETQDMLKWSYGGGGGEQESSSENDSTPYQQQYFDKLLGGANTWLNSGGFDKNYGGSAGFDSVADQNAAQTGAINGSVQTGNNIQNVLNGSGISSLGNFLGTYNPNNTGLTNAINANNNALDWNYSTTVAPQVRQGATDAGQYGSTRHGVAEGIAQSQLSQQKVNAGAQLAYQDQQAFNTNQANVLANLSNITTGLNSGNTTAYNAGSLTQQQEQNEINGQLEKWAYQNNVSLNDLMAYKNLISGDMGGSSQGSSSGTGGSGALGAIGSIGGAALGSYLGSK